MRSFYLITILCVFSATSMAQKVKNATLRVSFPAHLIYDTLLVKNSEGEQAKLIKTLKKKGSIINTYLLKWDPIEKCDFSIYFGGSSSRYNDSIFFRGNSKNMFVHVKDSFNLKEKTGFELIDVSNFEELYGRYLQDQEYQIAKYYSRKDQTPTMTFKEYTLQAGFDFVKRNLNNQYIAELFSVFVINPRTYAPYKEALNFYTMYLKPELSNPGSRDYIESKIELLLTSLNEGQNIPDFSASTIVHQQITNKVLEGKNVLINFWATWCAPCMEEVPDLKQIHHTYKDDNFKIISITLDHDSLKFVSTIKEYEMDWIHIFRPEEKLLDAFRINPIPAIFLINEEGIIIYNTAVRGKDKELTGLQEILKEKFKH